MQIRFCVLAVSAGVPAGNWLDARSGSRRRIRLPHRLL
jgi:hypothetical protein